MRILIADDHPVFRKGLAKVLEGEVATELVAETGDGAEALRLIEKHRPDIAVVDISMPNMSGLEIVKAAREKNLPVKFIILTMYKEEEYFNQAMDLGVKGYILKESAVTDLLDCLKLVAQGKYYVSPIISEYLINRTARQDAILHDKPSLRDLTPMERRILKLIAENKTSREIAAQLFISYRTVQNHRTNICAKLGLKGYNKLLQFALEHKSYL
ncbi:MAG: response regulator transcription factor [candidate division KSB1 bacterium]|nr:response regulator transcription factor [candidate division KSB1 bacterium]MDZ7301697.1 response regulator transcription factor [candidate division KSB1 bacterium]MDZ7312416.1 response regulator transcription factor [candidate division KSB1 bacterium]